MILTSLILIIGFCMQAVAGGTNQTHVASLITVTNEVNAPFHWHSSLEMCIRDETGRVLTRSSFGLYPDLDSSTTSTSSTGARSDHGRGGFITRLFRRAYRFIRPLLPCKSKVLSPDPLYEGRCSQSSDVSNGTSSDVSSYDTVREIPVGSVIYREDFDLSEEQWQELRSLVSNWNGSYCYWGWWDANNCSSWIRTLLNRILAPSLVDEPEGKISCRRWYLHVPQFLGGMILRLPITPVDFPKFCHSGFKTEDHYRDVYLEQYKNSTQLRTTVGQAGTLIR